MRQNKLNNFAGKYLDKNNSNNIEFSGAPPGLLKYIVIIPAFSEPDIFNTLQSLLESKPTDSYIEVHILVNYPENISQNIKETNNRLYLKIKKWCQLNSKPHFEYYSHLKKNLPGKHAGVGYARKILMDLAVERFSKINRPDGIILSLDADTTVPENYFSSIEETKNKKQGCLVFNFAHPISGNEFNMGVYEGAAQYELHLRYYKHILRSVSFPFYEYTVGSCFGISAQLYILCGGMSKRKAGEDFYFLQKAFKLVQPIFYPHVIVHPSPRPSWRVPFGTGPTVKKMLLSKEEYLSYNPESFTPLKQLGRNIQWLYKSDSTEHFLKRLPAPLGLFLQAAEFNTRYHEMRSNTSSFESFQKRFHAWFDGFQVIKYLNFCRNNYYPDIPVTLAAKKFLKINSDKTITAMELLTRFRHLDKTISQQ